MNTFLHSFLHPYTSQFDFVVLHHDLRSAYTPMQSSVLEAQSVQTQHTFLGNDLPSYSWSVKKTFDQEVHDPLNFGFNQNILGLLLAITTVMCVLLPTDIFLRLIVRALSDEISTVAVSCASLMSRSANLLYLYSAIRRV